MKTVESEHLRMAQQITLRRCPFCGARAVFETALSGNDHYVRCTGCGACQIGGEPLEVVRRWQARIDADLLRNFSVGMPVPELLRKVPFVALSALVNWLER